MPTSSTHRNSISDGGGDHLSISAAAGSCSPPRVTSSNHSGGFKGLYIRLADKSLHAPTGDEGFQVHHPATAPSSLGGATKPRERVPVPLIPPSILAGGVGPEKEKTRRLSCKECRRLKLKCDRVFPCQSCVKRGCAEICPEGSSYINCHYVPLSSLLVPSSAAQLLDHLFTCLTFHAGALTGGRGSRFILQNTEQLHDKISQLTERIRHLESGLEDLCSRFLDGPHHHPLLVPELLAIKNTHGLEHAHPTNSAAHHNYPRPSPVLQVGELHSSPGKQDSFRQGFESTRVSPTEPEEDLRKAVNTVSVQEQYLRGTEECSRPDCPNPLDLPEDLLNLSTAFPFPWTVDLSIRKKIRAALPSIDEARYICGEAERNALWQYNLNPSESFIPNLIHYCYHTELEHLRPRRLALLLMILSIGSLVDVSRPTGVAQAQAYHHLARASLSEHPLMEEPDYDTLHTLMFMLWWYLNFWDDNKAIGYAWNILGFTAKLAHALGIHRSISTGKRLPEEDEKRRAIYWELLNIDYRLSLSMARPPSLHLDFVQVPPPSYSAEGLQVPPDEIVYHEWKYSFLTKCLGPTLHAMMATHPVRYEDVLRLDAEIRDFPTPLSLRLDHKRKVDHHSSVMRGEMASISRDVALLQLHRRYLIAAIGSQGATYYDRHPFAPSVVATCLSVANVVNSVENLYRYEPVLSARFLVFWFNAFSAAVTLGLIIQRLPGLAMADLALESFSRCFSLFHRVAPTVPFVRRSLPTLEEIRAGITQHHSRMPLDKPVQPEEPELPPAFRTAHAAISQAAQEMGVGEGFQGPLSLNGADEAVIDSTNIETLSVVDVEEERRWLPSIYNFRSAGVGLDTMSLDEDMVPGPGRSGRFSDLHGLRNMEYGALAMDIDDTSFMGWL